MGPLSDLIAVTQEWQNTPQESVRRLSDRPTVTQYTLQESMRRLSDRPTVTQYTLQESVKRLSDPPRDVKS